VTRSETKHSFSPLRSRLTKSLGCSEDRKRLEIFLKHVKAQNTFSDVDKVEILLQMAKSEVGSRVILQDLNNSDEIMTLFKSSKDFGIFMNEFSSHLLSDNDFTILKQIGGYKLSPARKIEINNAIQRVHRNKMTSQTVTLSMMHALPFYRN